jgi:hypothetical protein
LTSKPRAHPRGFLFDVCRTRAGLSSASTWVATSDSLQTGDMARPPTQTAKATNEASWPRIAASVGATLVFVVEIWIKAIGVMILLLPCAFLLAMLLVG